VTGVDRRLPGFGLALDDLGLDSRPRFNTALKAKAAFRRRRVELGRGDSKMFSALLIASASIGCCHLSQLQLCMAL
jgi:hypothetical protein